MLVHPKIAFVETRNLFRFNFLMTFNRNSNKESVLTLISRNLFIESEMWITVGEKQNT